VITLPQIGDFGIAINHVASNMTKPPGWDDGDPIYLAREQLENECVAPFAQSFQIVHVSLSW
jgi:hypothetical protein